MMGISEEDRLLLKLADPELSVRTVQLRKSLPWDRIIHKAQLHGVSLIVYLNLRQIDSSEIPPGVLVRMNQTFQRSLLRSLFMLHHLEEIMREFKKEGIRATLLRGPAVAVTLYPHSGMRTFDDIDLLLEKKDIRPAKGILEGLGYRLFSPEEEQYDYTYRGELQFIRSAPMTMLVELHWDIINSRSLKVRTRVEAKDLTKPRPLIELDVMHVYMLAPEDLLLSLCVHTAYSHQYYKLIALCDILQLSRRLGACFDWHYFIGRTRELRVNMAVYYALFLSKTLFDAQLAGEIMQEILPSRELQIFCKMVLPPRLVIKGNSIIAKLSRKLFREGLKRL